MVLAWGKTTADVANSKKEIADSQKKIADMGDAIARIETHQEYTRAGIDEIRKELRRKTYGD